MITVAARLWTARDIEKARKILATVKPETQAIREIAKIRTQLAPILSTGGLHLLEHLDLQHRLDRKWLRGVLVDIESGKVRDVTDLKRLTYVE